MKPRCSFPMEIGSRKGCVSLFYVSQGLLHLIWNLARFFFQLVLVSQSLCQLILDLAEFLLAYFGSRKMIISLCWVSQGFCRIILDLAEFLSAYF